MKQRNSIKKLGSLYLLACLILLSGFSPFAVAQAAPDSPIYQVVFDPEDGSSYHNWHKASIPEGGRITDPPADPQKEGFIFEGWAYAYDENGNLLLWDFNRPAGEKNMTLWASWTKEDNGNHAGIGNGTAGADNNSAGTIQDKTDTTSKNPATGKEGNYFLGFLAVLGVLSFGALALLKHQR